MTLEVRNPPKLPDVQGNVLPFSIPFCEWVDKHGFLIKDVWDIGTGTWGRTGWMQLLPLQRRLFEFALRMNSKMEFIYSTFLYSTIKKSGKALDLNTPIPTPSGWTTMASIKVGDWVFDDQGVPTKVVFATDTMENHACYRVCFSDGTSIVADADHVWTVNKRTQYGIGEVQDITTKQMANSDLELNGARVYSIKIDKPLKLQSLDLPIHPYLLGAWLGDGSSATSTITCGPDDAEEMIELLKVGGHPVKLVQNKNRSPSIRFSLGSGGSWIRRRLSLSGVLKSIGLYKNKFIPVEYLRSSIEQRRDLLCGLMDTDGYVSINGRCEFTTTSSVLAYQVKELLRSLGVKTSIIVGNAVLNGRLIGLKYRLHFTPDFPVFKMQRKLVRQVNKGETARSRYVRIVDVYPVESVPVKCIQVDSSSHLYLAGDGMIPTHNTNSAAAIGSWYAEVAPPGSEIYVIANDLESAEGRVMADMKYHALYRGYKVKQYEIILPNGTFVKALAQNYKSVAGSRHALVLFDELWGVTCTDIETECYSKEGWKKYNELSIGDEIATINPTTMKFEWHPVNGINVIPYSGQMCSFNHRRVKMLVTPNHRVFGRFRSSGQYRLDDKPFEFKSAAEAVMSYEMRLPTSIGFSGTKTNKFLVPGCTYRTRNYIKEIKPKEYDLEPFVKLLGYYLSEGSITYYIWKDIRVPIGFAIGQRPDKHPDEYRRIKETLDEIGIFYRHDKFGFRVQNKRLAAYFSQFGKSYDKFIPHEIKELDQEHLEKLFLAFMDGDGWKAGMGWQTELASKRLIDDLVEVGTKIGYIAKYMGRRWRTIKNENKTHWMYRASFSLGNITLDKRNMKVIQDWSGLVWCPSVENKTWLARKDGTVFWTGNSELTRRTYEEMTPISTIPWSLRAIATYAGFINESDLLWDLYLKGVGKDEHEDGRGRPINELIDLPVWANERQLTYWNHDPIMPWQTPEYFEEQRSQLRPAAYLRLHENRWVTTHEEFVPQEWWTYAENQMQDSAELWKDHPYSKFPVYIAVDAAPKRDSTAISGTTYDPTNGTVIELFHKIWTPTNNVQLDLDETVSMYLRDTCKSFNVAIIGYDPAHLYQLMLNLSKEGLPVKEVLQNVSNMTKISQNLFDLLKFKRFKTYKDDEARAHIQNTVAQSESTGIRIVKHPGSFRKKPVDYAVALAMSAYLAVSSGGIDVSQPLVVSSPFSDLTAWHDGSGTVVPWQFQN